MRFRNQLRRLPTLVASVGFALGTEAVAQTFTTLHSFSALHLGISNNDGASPTASLTLSGNTLYGTAAGGGNYGFGTVFKLGVDGTGFEVLYHFEGTNGGATPSGSLVLSSSTLYGTTEAHGTSNYGTVFKVETDGTAFADLHDFTGGGNGAAPQAPLLLSGNTLYGTTAGGNGGTVFKIDVDGTGFTVLHSFTTPSASTPFTNSDGADPEAGLVSSSNILYGTTRLGGIFGNGTIFAVNIDGTGFKTLHIFTNSDGIQPAGLIVSGTSLYGTTAFGGSGGSTVGGPGGGTVFTLRTDGTDLKTLHSFPGAYINAEGHDPNGGLLLSGTTLYGTASQGGDSGNGTIFQVNTDGTGFRVLHSFAAPPAPAPFTNSEGAFPLAGLVLSSNILYGTADTGGTLGNGTIFSFSLPPELAITPDSQCVILSWSTNFTGFTLQSTTNLASAVWTTNVPTPVLINGQYTVTNPISGTRQFFRLSQ